MRITEYQYDALSRRIRKVNKDESGNVTGGTEFYWNDDVLLSEQSADITAEQRGNGKVYVFEPGTFKPLAFVQGGEINHYHLDHLGTPQEITNADGELVWTAQYKAYGSLALAAVQQVENNLRFQGQYYDEESGLHYNRHRYYDPECGRFINQDPIGLLGGDNNYLYVPNPVTWVDPLGLSCKEGGPTGTVYTKTKQMDVDYTGEHLPGNTVWDFFGTHVEYLDAAERQKYELFVQDGLLVDSNGNLFDSYGDSGTGNGSAIFVMDPQGRIYASNSPMMGEFHHSSFLSGAEVASAGEIEVINGRIVDITDRSGHYKPDPEHMEQFSNELAGRGADLSAL